MLIGGILEYLFAFVLDIILHKPLRINKRFTLGKKVSFFSLPIWGILFIVFLHSQIYALIFLSSAVLGTILEAGMGRMTSRIYGAKIWVYKHGALGDYTSIYSIPYWGVAGVIFAALGKTLGL
jgi:hypothetical protein